MGVRGMNLSDGDVVIGMQISSQGKEMLIVSEKGMARELPWMSSRVRIVRKGSEVLQDHREDRKCGRNEGRG